MEMASFIALPFAKNMALLPLEEPKIGTENDLAPRARIKAQDTLGNECYVKGSSKPGYCV